MKLLAKLRDGHTEELFPGVELVDLESARVGEVPFKLWCVLAEDHSVNVEAERHAGVSELMDAVRWVKPTGKPNLEHVLPKEPTSEMIVNIEPLYTCLRKQSRLQHGEQLTLHCDRMLIMLEQTGSRRNSVAGV